MSGVINDALKKILSEIEAQAITSQKQITASNIQRQAKEKEKKTVELILKELSDLKNNENIYSTIGKAFIKEDIDEVKKKLTMQINDISKEIDSLNKKILYHETTLANTQPHIQRIING
ncbi:hypothetical protein PORY_001776 [Pneumocystis oryctolagi]|uniref:Uncharacterized protein n=1 Tax=Pneumocystis oryctolagi TaxID=42067 RepID=A0ACB7CAY4_9ASCO|nr:hypothetical protein PORY_001776 [Pneumocystis oryctolagi]